MSTYYQLHKEEIKRKARERRNANLEEVKRREKAYRDANKEQVKERSKKWYYENKEQSLQLSKKWREQNKQKKYEIDKAWREKQRETKLNAFNELAEKYKHVSYQNYEVFENGQIWSCRFYQFLNGTIDQQDYENVQIYKKNGEKIGTKRSRVIATAFDDRDESELKELHCHHCNLNRNDNSLDNLVFLNNNLHLLMHKNLTNEQIILIGEQVKHLRGSAKTKQFENLVLGAFTKLTLTA